MRTAHQRYKNCRESGLRCFHQFQKRIESEVPALQCRSLRVKDCHWMHYLIPLHLCIEVSGQVLRLCNRLVVFCSGVQKWFTNFITTDKYRQSYALQRHNLSSITNYVTSKIHVIASSINLLRIETAFQLKLRACYGFVGSPLASHLLSGNYRFGQLSRGFWSFP